MENLKIPKQTGEKVHREPVKSNRFVDRDTILFFYGQLEEKVKAKKAAAKAEAAVRKQFANTGVTLNIFDTMVRLSQQDDPDAVQKFFDEFVYLADVFSQPVGAQLGLFEGAGNPADAMKKAFASGRDLGLRGKNPDDQAYPQNTDLGQEHYRGWQDGQEVQRQKFLQVNQEAREAEAAKEAKLAEAAKRKEEREAKAAEKAGRKVPTTADGETVQ
jgi:hypothetical protein